MKHVFIMMLFSLFLIGCDSAPSQQEKENLEKKARIEKQKETLLKDNF